MSRDLILISVLIAGDNVIGRHASCKISIPLTVNKPELYLCQMAGWHGCFMSFAIISVL